MLSFLAETNSVWQNLKAATKPIVLYGMGNGADRILDCCAREGISVAGVFASDEFVRGQQFRGFTIATYKDLLARLGDFVVVIAFASELPELLNRFTLLASKHETYAPHVPLFDGEETVSVVWLERYATQLQEVYAKLADDWSRAVFADILNYKLSGKLAYLFAHTTERRQDLTQLLTWTGQEVYADLGAYNGDTLREFLELTGRQYQHIYALEPDTKNFARLTKFVQAEHLKRCTLVPCAIGAARGLASFLQKGGRMSALGAAATQVEVITLDDLCTLPPTYIKLDVEGAEEAALNGGQRLISQQKPSLFCAAYHHDEDLWRLPLLLWSWRPDYKIYLRRHPYVPCWEINLLAR